VRANSSPISDSWWLRRQLAGQLQFLDGEPFQQTDFWAQGTNFGLDLTW
jgi:hypothetical protein